MGIYTLFTSVLSKSLQLLSFINKSSNPLIRNKPQSTDSEMVNDSIQIKTYILSAVGLVCVLSVTTAYLTNRWRNKLNNSRNLPAINHDSSIKKESEDLLYKLHRVQSLLSTIPPKRHAIEEPPRFILLSPWKCAKNLLKTTKTNSSWDAMELIFDEAQLKKLEDTLQEALDVVKNRKITSCWGDITEDDHDEDDQETNQSILEVLDNTEEQFKGTMPSSQHTLSCAHNFKEDQDISSERRKVEDTNIQDNTHSQEITASDLMRTTQNQIPISEHKLGSEGRTLVLQIGFNKRVKFA